MKEKHHKHPPLKRRKLGHYHQNEWAIYGTSCGEVEAFYNLLADYFDARYRFTYVDADHSDLKQESTHQIGKKKYSQSHLNDLNSFDDKLNIPLSQAVFVNGNHYPADKQIVIINPKKRDSLYRRIEQLTQIDLVILQDEESEIFDFVRTKMTEQTLVLYRTKMQSVFDFIESEIEKKIPPLKALILAGGKSTRMQEDKSKLKYHDDKSQEEYLAEMTSKLGIESYISKSAKEEKEFIGKYPVIKDRLLDMGPFGGILSAFISDPEAAWMVVACDLPYIEESALKQLIEARSLRHLGTAFKLESNPFPEPLIAIYEPAIYKRMLDFLTLGYACPRKVLINSHIKEVILEDENIAFNVNTPEEKELVIKKFNLSS